MLLKNAICLSLVSVQLYATIFQKTVAMLDREYNCPVSQKHIKNYSKSLQVRGIENGVNVSVGLLKVYELILKLFRQVPPSHRRDAHRSECLQKTVPSYQ